MTVREYDLQEWTNQFKQILIPIALLLGLHLYGGFTQPLLIQTILPWKSIYGIPLVQVRFYFIFLNILFYFYFIFFKYFILFYFILILLIYFIVYLDLYSWKESGGAPGSSL